MSGRSLGSGSLKKVRNGRGQLVYRGTWTGQDGTYHRKLLSSDRRVAERMLAAIIRQRDLAIQGLGVEEGQDRLLSEIIATYLVNLRAHRSLPYAERCASQLQHLLAEIGDAPIKRLSREQVVRYRSRRSDSGASNRTCNLEIGVLKACIKWALEQGLIGSNPLAGLKALPQGEAFRTRKRHALSDAEIARLLHATQQDDQQQEDFSSARKTVAGGSKGKKYARRKRRVRIPQALLWETVLLTALRYTEAITLRWADIDAQSLTIRVRADISKSHRSREIPIGEDILERLLALRPIQALATGRMPSRTDPVFLSPKGKPYTPYDSGNTLKTLYRVLKLARLPRRTELGRCIDFHALRTTCGTRWARQGVPPQVLQVLMGHADISTTMEYYVFLRTEDTRRALRLVSDLPAPKAPEEEIEGADPRVPCTKPASQSMGDSEGRVASQSQPVVRETVDDGGPCRTRTCDRAIMSRLL